MRLSADTLLPYSRALCSPRSAEHKEHPRQRCAVGRTALGVGRQSWLFKMHMMDIEDIPFEHRELYLPLYQLAQAFASIGEKNGYRLQGIVSIDGPFPAYRLGVSQYVGQGGKIDDTNKQAERILSEMDYVPDMVCYRLIGEFLPTSRAALPENPVYGRPYLGRPVGGPVSQEVSYAASLES